MDNLNVSGRKRLLSEADDTVLTPKKARAIKIATPTPSKSSATRLPSLLQQVFAAYNAVEDALIPALASGGVAAPSADKENPELFNIPAVLNHLTVPGLNLDNLKRLVYLLEWDPTRPSPPKGKHLATPAKAIDDDNPFVDPASGLTKDWVRGGHGIIITHTTHLNRSTGRRSAVYGVGIQVEAAVGTSKKKGRAGMNTVIQWLGGNEDRKGIVEDKLRRWIEHHRRSARQAAESSSSRASSPTPAAIPHIPMADLPNLTPPSVSTSSNSSSPVKRLFQTPTKPSVTPSKSGIPFPTPVATPSSSTQIPSTPSSSSSSVNGTPSTARRDALRERIRQRSLQADATPTRNRVAITVGVEKDGTARTKIVGQEELRRRVVLGRLDWIAECVASLFSVNGVNGQRRRMMKMDEVVKIVVKSAKSPISDAETAESLELLMSLCPTFTMSRTIDREAWIEMPFGATPASSPTKAQAAPPSASKIPTSTIPSTPRKPRIPTSPGPPPSPSRRFPISPGRRLDELEEELLSRKVGPDSPKRIRTTSVLGDGDSVMTLREVREKIKRELEKE